MRVEKKRLVAAALSVALGTGVVGSPARAAPLLYLWNGTQLTLVTDNVRPVCGRWALWYFETGAPQVPGSQWGEESGKSPEEVLASQKRDDRFDRIWTRATSTPYPSKRGFTNFAGPICIASRTQGFRSLIHGAADPPDVADAKRRFDNYIARVIGRISDLNDLKEKAEQIAEQRSHSPDWYLESGEFSAYMTRLKAASDHAQGILKTLNGVVDKNYPNITSSLSGIESSFEPFDGALRTEISSISRYEDRMMQPTSSDASVEKCAAASATVGAVLIKNNCAATIYYKSGSTGRIAAIPPGGQSIAVEAVEVCPDQKRLSDAAAQKGFCKGALPGANFDRGGVEFHATSLGPDGSKK